MLNRDQILKAVDRKMKDVEVPEWGGTVRLGSISAETLFKFRDLSAQRDRGASVERDIIGVVIAGSIMGDDNQELFTEADIPALMKKSPEIVMRVFQAAMELNNLKPKTDADGNALPIDPVGDARKNS